MKAALLAEYLCNLQPLHVRNRLLQDQTFGTRFGLVSRTVITLGGDMHIDQQKLVAAVRQALADQRAVSLMVVAGHEMVVQVEQGQVFLESLSQGKRYQFDEL